MSSGRVPLSSVDLSGLERRYVLEALDRAWISSTGTYVGAFERAIGARIGRAFVAATSSGTSALDLVLRALGVGPGDEVICPALTFAAPASAVLAVGATPVFADVTEESWTIDPDEVRRMRTPRTRAMIAVDVLGHPCRYAALADLDLPIIEDAAEAHGARYEDRPVGGFGLASVFSLQDDRDRGRRLRGDRRRRARRADRATQQPRHEGRPAVSPRGGWPELSHDEPDRGRRARASRAVGRARRTSTWSADRASSRGAACTVAPANSAATP